MGGVARAVYGLSRLKKVKIDDFSKNVPNHPDFAPGKFGGSKPTKRVSFITQAPRNLYTNPLTGQY